MTGVVRPQVEQCVGAVEPLARFFKDIAPAFRGGSGREFFNKIWLVYRAKDPTEKLLTYGANTRARIEIPTYPIFLCLSLALVYRRIVLPLRNQAI
jgi:hypothetical protein